MQAGLRAPRFSPCYVLYTSRSVPRSLALNPVAMASQRPFGGSKPVKKGFIVLVTAQIGAGQLPKLKELFAPLAAHVAANEEGCYAYELSVSCDNPDKLIIYERYKNKEYVEQVHWQSGPFKAFQQACKDAEIEWIEKSVVTYEEADVGF
eukprot:GHRQ01006854.1.p1 GENE.GHRQ01006854.1~~GHRQ01006854.1.p1  ORF type:complete len:150 (+),score=26.60 GHRQ01006854.1:60-509(+)